MKNEREIIQDFRIEAEYWDNHSPHDDCTLEPELFTTTYSAITNAFFRQNINTVGNIINGFKSLPREPVRTVPDGQSKNRILPLNDLPIGSLIKFSKETLCMEDNSGPTSYKNSIEYGVIQQTDPKRGEKYLHLERPPLGIHVAYPNSNIQVGEVKHVKFEGLHGEHWYLERVLSAQLLIYAKPELKIIPLSDDVSELKKNVIRRILKK